MKHILRSEGARDYGDILLSLNFKPTITIIDFAHVLAKHMNKRIQNYFHPNEGRVFAPTPDNLRSAKNKTLEPLHVDIETYNANLCLFDKFHENNTTKPEEVLRKTKYVSGININTQVQEQFFAQQTRKNYFLNYMSPIKHLFLMRLMFDDSNITICNKNMNQIEKRLKQQTCLDANGVLYIGSGEKMKVKSGDSYTHPVDSSLKTETLPKETLGNKTFSANKRNENRKNHSHQRKHLDS